MRIRLILSFLIVITSVLVTLYSDYFKLGAHYFYLLSSIILLDVIAQKRIEIIHIWIGGFFYTILAEVFISNVLEDTRYVLLAVKFYVLANNLVLLGYFLSSKKKMNTKRFVKRISKKRLFSTIAVLLMIYLLISTEGALRVAKYGRGLVGRMQEDQSNALLTVMQSVAFILPGLITYYFVIIKKRSVFSAFFVSLPVFVLLFLGGSRFPLLYAFTGFILVSILNYKSISNFKRAIILIVPFGLLAAGGIVMKQIRNGAFGDNTSLEIKKYGRGVPQIVSSYMSDEGVLDMTSLMMKHFEHHPHTYGKSVGFLLYFWVPRDIWPEKPTMLGYWFVRLYRTGFSTGHSTSFGFAGELFADVGWFSLSLCFLMGIGLKKVNRLIGQSYVLGDISFVIISLAYPWVFFSVRSPVTSSTTYVGAIIIYYFISKIISKKKKLSLSQSDSIM